MKKTLLVLAAGMGSRYKGGIKQIAPVGPNGEILLHYSIYDAVRAGFDKIVFIIKRDIEEDFKEKIGAFAEEKAEIHYCFQDEAYLPEGFVFPAGRIKMFGTVQAMLAGKDVIKEPFAIINADDFYGRSSFELAAKALDELAATDKGLSCMVGYKLSNTISYNGTVNRGVCLQDDSGYLTGVEETYDIFPSDGKLIANFQKGNEKEVEGSSLVSMNFWEFKETIFEDAIRLFDRFIDSIDKNDAKSEYVLPTMVDDLIKENKLKVKVLPCDEVWHGITYPTDREEVAASIADMTEKGIYPSDLIND